MSTRGGEDPCTELPALLRFVRTVAEQAWAHWGPGQDTGERWGGEDCGVPPAEPHPMAELWSFPEGRPSRKQVAHVAVEDYSATLRTYEACDVRVMDSDTEHPQWRPLAESQASPRRLLPRDQPHMLVDICRDKFAQRRHLQEEITALKLKLVVVLESLEEGDQEHSESLSQKLGTLCSVLADWETSYQQQAQARQPLNQLKADLQAAISHLGRQADQEADPARATALRSDYRALVKQHNALLQQREQDDMGQVLKVCIGVGGLSQEDRDAWNTYAQLEPDPSETQSTRMRRSTVARTSPWRQLFDDGWRPLWLPARPVRRERVINDIMAHLLLYLWQEGIAKREEVTPRLQSYIQSVCRTMPQSDVGYALEVILKEFALPMHANTLRDFLKKQRVERIDPRLVRDAGIVDAQSSDDTEEVGTPRGRRQHTRLRLSQEREPQQSSSTREVVSQAGLSASKVRYKSQRMGLRVGRHGRYVRYALTAGARLRQEAERKQLCKGLICLRALVQFVHNETEEEISTLCKPGGAAYKWIDRQQRAKKTPAQVFVTLEKDPAITDVIRRQPELLQHLRMLFEQLGWDVPWPEKHYQRTTSSQGRTLSFSEEHHTS